jgi:hypothetical protein
VAENHLQWYRNNKQKKTFGSQKPCCDVCCPSRSAFVVSKVKGVFSCLRLSISYSIRNKILDLAGLMESNILGLSRTATFLFGYCRPICIRRHESSRFPVNLPKKLHIDRNMYRCKLIERFLKCYFPYTLIAIFNCSHCC